MNATMSNKDFFKTLPRNVQMSIIDSLCVYDKTHVEYACGKYEVTSNWCISKHYAPDHKVLNEFTAKEFFNDILWYHKAWENFKDKKKRAGEKNTNGEWQDEFEREYADKVREEALQNYLK